MTQWNPNAPEVIGLEWMPGKPQANPVGDATSLPTCDVLWSDGTMYMQRARSLAAETIGSFQVPVAAVFAGRLMLEVYPAGSELPGAPTSANFYPTGDGGVINAQNQAGAVVNLWASVDEASLDTSDYITQGGAVLASIYGPTFSALAGWPAGRRVLDIRITYSVSATTATRQQVTSVVLDNAGTNFGIRRDEFANTQGVVTFTSSLGPDNPFNGLPWSQADIVALSTAAADLEIPLVFERAGGGVPAYRLHQMFITIDWCPETRLAVASAEVPANPVISNISFTNVRAPDTAVPNWAKANNTLYTYALRRTRRVTNLGTTNTMLVPPSGWFYFPWLDSSVTAPMQVNGQAVSYTATLGAGYRPTSLGAAQTRLRSILPRTTAPAYSESTQPYKLRILYPIYNGGTAYASQQVTATATRTFERLRFVCRPQVSNGANPIIVKISDAAAYGAGTTYSTISIPYADVIASQNVGTATAPWYLVDVIIPAVTINIGVIRYVHFECGVGVVNGAGYDLAYMYTSNTSTSFGTYLEGTNAGHLQAVADGRIDFAVTLSTLPTTPTGFTTSILAVDLPGSDTNAWEVGGYEAVQLDWDATADVLADYFEIQRYDDNSGGEWETIGYANVVSVGSQLNTWVDYQAAPNIESCYRIRLVRTDGSASEWTSESCETPVNECSYLFTSNEDPSINVGYMDVNSGGGEDTPPRVYRHLDAERRVMFPVFGRDGQLSIRPSERLGDAMEFAVLVAFKESPAPAGRWAFDEVESLQHADVHDLALMDETGRRWYVSVVVPQSTRQEPESSYTATIQATTARFTATPVMRDP